MNRRPTVNLESALSNRYLWLAFVLLLMLPGKVLAQGPQVVTCASDDMRRHYCDVGPNSDIRLLRQRSDSRCEMGRSYGFRGNQIWVDRGCRADFEVMARYTGGDRGRDWNRDHDRGPDQNYNSGLASQIVTCSSDNMRRNYCNIGPHGEVRMTRQRSESPCQLNRTYGVRGDSIWVDRGCRADFEIISRGSR